MKTWEKTITFVLITVLLTLALLMPLRINAQIISKYGGRSYAGNAPVAFTLTINSPTNQTTYSNKMTLDFTINWTAVPELLPIGNWTFGEKYAYSIDDNSAVSITPNSSVIAIPFPWSYGFSTSVDISNLTNVYHNITILASMDFGPNTLFNQSTIPVTFIVQNPIPSQTPYLPPRNPPQLTLLDYVINISIAIAAIVPLLIILLLYKRHRKNASTSRESN
jgi:hypothetical protein